MWCRVLMANYQLYQEGTDDAPGQILYSLTDADDTAASEMLNLTQRLWDLVEATAPNPDWSTREQELSKLLADGRSFFAGFRLPENWLPLDREYRVSSVVFHRAHLPGRKITSKLLPLIIVPRMPFHAIIVPCEYWPNEVHRFIEETNAKDELKRLQSAHGNSASTENLHKAREAAYQEVFGPINTVLHPIIPGPFHIDVYTFSPCEARDFWTFATGGISDHEQPATDDSTPLRTELVMYAREKQSPILEMLQNLAHQPWATGMGFGSGHTLSLGSHSKEMLGSDRFPAVLFIGGLRAGDSRLGGMVEIEGEGVWPLQVVPLTSDEFEFFQQQGLAAFFDQIDKSPHSIVFSPDRPSILT